MATNLQIGINYVDADVPFSDTPTDFIIVDEDNDYLIWTTGDDVVKDLMTAEPTADELNAAATIIDEEEDVTIPQCLLMDYSHNVGGSYYTHKVIGMGENKRYVFLFSFDGPTATEPQLEAWDTSAHSTADKNVLGLGTPNDSMVKAVCTTLALPGTDWAGSPIAGTNVLLLNDGNGALDELETGETSHDLYANIKLVVPAGYSIPYVEQFVLSIRYSWSE